MSFDPQRYAMEYHIIGFRECASEVARYLVTIEGMDIQDPLRLRLMSHLQCFLSQRELSAKSSTNSTWCGLPNSYQSGYNAHIATPITAQHPQQNANPHNYNPSSSYMLGSSYLSSNYAPDYSTTSDYGTSLSSSGASQNLSTSHHASTSGSNNTSASPAPVPSSVESQQPQDPQQQPIYAELTSINDKHQNYNYENSSQSFGPGVNNGYNNNINSKPYRPWHPDTMAY